VKFISIFFHPTFSISKPILEYVIFCHQEDSLWPFEDSKKLKEKFDDIFQSSEYVKVMAQLKKERKTQQDHYSFELRKYPHFFCKNFDFLKKV